MSGSQPLKSYSLSVAQQDVPSSWMPDPRPRLANTAARRIVSIASQSGTVQPGQPMRFQLPANMGAGFLVSGSAYIKFTINVTQAVAPSWAFKQSGSGSSVFQRVSAVLSGAQIESINMYNKLYNNLLLHATNTTYAGGDARIHEGAFTVFTDASATVCVPIALACLNSQSHLPLFFLSSAELQFETESLLEAITQLSANAVTGYTIDQATVCFEQLVPEPAYEQGIKAMLASRVYQMKLDTWMNNRYSHQASITQTVGLNSSSVRCVLWGSVEPQAQDLAGYQKASAQTSAQIYADGALVHNSRLPCVNAAGCAEQFCESQRCLNLLFDTSRTSVAPTSITAAATDQLAPTGITRARYFDGAFLGGVSLNRESLDNGSFSFVGTPVQNLVLAWQGSAINNGQFYVFIAVQQILTIDMSGSVNLIR